ncbi:hypothetical protein EV424DRAFT_881244 [Suillus variegatus]|nr:hypothetical protein EV424DRAFT_881244 [Suillus variegatus]
MAYAEGGGLDTSKQCLSGTCMEILSEITDWVNSTGDDVQRVLWSSGPAGKGKSAIARIKVCPVPSYYLFPNENSKLANAPLDYHLTKSNTKSSSNSWCPRVFGLNYGTRCPTNDPRLY